jgi:hypothetical protein
METTKPTRIEYNEHTRPIPCSKLAHQLSVWLALGCQSERFDPNLVRSMVGKFYKSTRINNIEKELAMSNQQFSILYNIWEKFRVKNCFKFGELKFLCIDLHSLKDFEDIFSASGTKCEQFFFETPSDGKLTTEEFIEKYRQLITHEKYIKKIPETCEEDYE